MINELFNKIDRALFYTDSDLDYQDVLEALNELADCIDEADDVDWYIGEGGACSLDSLVVGAYWYCTDYHSGMFSDEYKLLCSIGRFFDPGCTNGPEPESTDCDVYNALETLGGYNNG